ncbi:alpha/beta fold hydrolase [Microcella frigidaquae]|uniref:Alpha-beta hydrolase superfamily lysophospholipase n=1 Tax=Microcella frigidaquae TaxID=424758 RepID=A0A840XM24_9MICO|nr:alpha/beta hydrolase [Microcella frigidaquae]MBB5617887.1 alpha-beta hydrolase superfamily lysophospholipase [Microcella frigidaquae]NHN44399.1 alpha/beta hydrolase [Microcella frigidaquae]
MPKFTAERQHRTFTDAHGVVVHYYVWAPGKPKAVVQLAHGVGEHALRYELLAQALVAAGYAVYADDHRGHGQTGVEYWKGDLSQIGKLGVGGLRATQQNLLDLTRIAQEENPGLPFVMLGHSWGSLMVQNLLSAGPHPWSAVVLTGTAFRTPFDMNGGDLNARHKHLGDTGAEWLSRDPAVARAFVDDPLTTDAKVLQLFGVADGLRLYGTPKAVQPPVPLLIMVGDDDPLGGEKSAKKLADAYLRRGGLTDVELIVYAGARHEVLNETNQAEVRADLIAWLDDRLF